MNLANEIGISKISLSRSTKNIQTLKAQKITSDRISRSDSDLPEIDFEYRNSGHYGSGSRSTR